MTKISVIVPVYNGEKYLLECLQSIQKQTFSDWECICVDDGSKDKSLGILQKMPGSESYPNQTVESPPPDEMALNMQQVNISVLQIATMSCLRMLWKF